MIRSGLTILAIQQSSHALLVELTARRLCLERIGRLGIRRFIGIGVGWIAFPTEPRLIAAVLGEEIDSLLEVGAIGAGGREVWIRQDVQVLRRGLQDLAARRSSPGADGSRARNQDSRRDVMHD